MKSLLSSFTLITSLLAQVSSAKHGNHGHRHVARAQSSSISQTQDAGQTAQDSDVLSASNELYFDAKFQDLMDDEVTSVQLLTPTVTPTVTITVSSPQIQLTGIAEPSSEEDDSDDEASSVPVLKRRLTFQSAVRHWGRAFALPSQLFSQLYNPNILEERNSDSRKAQSSNNKLISTELAGLPTPTVIVSQLTASPGSTTNNDVKNEITADDDEDENGDDSDVDSDTNDDDDDDDEVDTPDDAAGSSDDASGFAYAEEDDSYANNDADTANDVLAETESLPVDGNDLNKAAKSVPVEDHLAHKPSSLARRAATVAFTSTAADQSHETPNIQEENGDISESDDAAVTDTDTDADADSQSDVESDDESDDDSDDDSGAS